MTPTVWLRLLRSERANWLGTISKFFGGTLDTLLGDRRYIGASGASFSTIETVVEEKPLSSPHHESKPSRSSLLRRTCKLLNPSARLNLQRRLADTTAESTTSVSAHLRLGVFCRLLLSCAAAALSPQMPSNGSHPILEMPPSSSSSAGADPAQLFAPAGCAQRWTTGGARSAIFGRCWLRIRKSAGLRESGRSLHEAQPMVESFGDATPGGTFDAQVAGIRCNVGLA